MCLGKRHPAIANRPGQHRLEQLNLGAHLLNLLLIGHASRLLRTHRREGAHGDDQTKNERSLKHIASRVHGLVALLLRYQRLLHFVAQLPHHFVELRVRHVHLL